jgi:di/tricarboxylate transporter
MSIIVLVVSIVVMVLSSVVKWLPPFHVVASIGAAILVVTRVITEKEAMGSIEMVVVFLLAFMLPLGTALGKTGAGKMIAQTVIDLIGNGGPIVLTAALWLLTWVLTQFMSNTAACTLLCPVAYEIAINMNADPRAAVMAVFIASSIAVCTPLAIPANAMILGPGNVRFKDFIVPGLAVSLVCFIISMILLPIFYPFY